MSCHLKCCIVAIIAFNVQFHDQCKLDSPIFWFWFSGLKAHNFLRNIPSCGLAAFCDQHRREFFAVCWLTFSTISTHFTNFQKLAAWLAPPGALLGLWSGTGVTASALSAASHAYACAGLHANFLGIFRAGLVWWPLQNIDFDEALFNYLGSMLGVCGHLETPCLSSLFYICGCLDAEEQNKS